MLEFARDTLNLIFHNATLASEVALLNQKLCTMLTAICIIVCVWLCVKLFGKK